MEQTLVAIGDLHGCHGALEEILTDLDKRGAFMYFSLSSKQFALRPEYKLVFLGDYIDRGDESRKVLDTVMALKEQNSNVSTLMGNHELLALACVGDVATISDLAGENDVYAKWLYGTQTIHGLNGGASFVGEFGDTYLESMRAYGAAMGREGAYGRFLRSLAPFAMERTGCKNILFVHGGLSKHLDDKEKLDGFFEGYKAHMGQLSVNAKGKYMEDPLVNGKSPFWIRGRFFRREPEKIKAHLESVGVDAAIIGHTPDRKGGRVRCFADCVVDADVGMTASYGGHASAYVIADSKGIRAHYVRDGTVETLIDWSKKQR